MDVFCNPGLISIGGLPGITHTFHPGYKAYYADFMVLLFCRTQK